MSPTAAFAKIISQHKVHIRSHWHDKVLLEIPATNGISDHLILTGVLEILDLLSESFAKSGSNLNDEYLRGVYSTYISQRTEIPSYTFKEILAEIYLLQESVKEVLDAIQSLNLYDNFVIDKFIKDFLRDSYEIFHAIKSKKSQRESKYLQLFEDIISAADVSKPLQRELETTLDKMINGFEAKMGCIFLFQGAHSEICVRSLNENADDLSSQYEIAMRLARFNRGIQSEATVTVINQEYLMELRLNQLLRIFLRHKNIDVGIIYLGYAQEQKLDDLENEPVNTFAGRIATFMKYLICCDDAKHALSKLEQLRSEQKSKDEFMAKAAQNLLEPLACVQEAAGLMEIPRNQNLEKIIYGIGRSTRMVQDFVDFQNVAAGKKITLSMELMSMDGLIHKVVKDLEGVYGPRFHIGTKGKVEGFWNASSMERLIENLLINGIEQTGQENAVSVNISEGLGRVELTIHSEGTCLSAKDQARLFRTVNQAFPGPSEANAGVGIGLTVVYELVNAHGGTIEMKSAPDTGTLFTVSVPLDSRPYQS